MSKISKNILEKIQEDHLEPTPKWKFLLRQYSVWITFVLSLLVGSLAFSVSLALWRNNDWDLYKKTTDSLVEFIFLSLPVLWISALVIFAVFTIYNFKHTKRGYKYNTGLVILSNIVLSLVLGAGLFAGGVGERIDEKLTNEFTPYQNYRMKQMHKVWMNPERGVLIGEIIEVRPGIIILKDVKFNQWELISEDTVVRGGIAIEPKIRIRAFGDRIDDFRFKAEEIRPFFSHRKMMGKMKYMDQEVKKQMLDRMQNQE